MEEKIDMIEMGKRIAARRKELKFTQKELGYSLNISKQSVYNLEKGKNKKTDIDMLQRLTVCLKCTQDYLLGLSNRPFKTKENMKDIFYKYPQSMANYTYAETDILMKSPEFVQLINRCKNELDKDDFPVLCLMINLVLNNSEYKKMLAKEKAQKKVSNINNNDT